jgi:hypothetical protein
MARAYQVGKTGYGCAPIRAALRATLIANSYLQGEVERLEGAASPGFARRRRRRMSKAAEGTEKKVG